MKTMIKALSLFVAFAFCLSLFASCSKGKQEAAGTISGFNSQAHVQVSDSETENGETSKAPLAGDFMVSDKKYDYRDGNLELLYVENQTNRHYNVTINGKYLDEDGNVIKEETQTFTGFPSGWANHFIFWPQTAFDSFTYEVKTEEYVPDGATCDENGDLYASFITMSYEKKMRFEAHWIGGYDDDGIILPKGKGMMMNVTVETTHPTDAATVMWKWLVLDEQGNIYRTNFDMAEQYGWLWKGTDAEEVQEGTSVGWSDGEDMRVHTVRSMIKYFDPDEEAIVPDNVQNKFTAIFAVTSIELRIPPEIPDDISIEYIYG